MLANQHVRFGERVTGDPHKGQPLPTRPQDILNGMVENVSGIAHQLRLFNE
jgi:hypothetical protein